jgi:membrane protease YdiL (CAAX protease family)
MSETEQLPAISAVGEANELQRKRWRPLIDIVIVLAITLPQYDGWILPDRIMRWFAGRPFPGDDNLASFVLMWINVAVVLILIRLSGEPWAKFGIKRLNASVDILSGCLTCIISYVVCIAGVDVFLDLMKDAFGERLMERLSQESLDAHALGPSGLLTILGLSITVGLSEELVTRGFLLTRLEKVTSRPWLSVLLSSIIFGCAHANGGIVLVWNAFLCGLVLGASFVLTRSLWPPVIAHVMLDITAMLHLAR